MESSQPLQGFLMSKCEIGRQKIDELSIKIG